MGKHSLVEDEIPLTQYPSPTRSITVDTRSRFDDLLRSALTKEKGTSGKKKKRDKNTADRDLEKLPPERENTSTVTFISEKPKKPGFVRGDNIDIDETQEVHVSSSDDDVITQNPAGNNSGGLIRSGQLPSLKVSKNLKQSNRDELKKNEELAEVKEKRRTQSQSVQYFDSSSDDDKNNKNAVRRRLSYTIHKADVSDEVSPPREASPKKPVPVPRKRRDKKPETQRNKLSTESSQDLIEDDREPAPPLYSATSASYENLEKDGGPVPKVRRKAKKMGDIEMQNLKASYEEISPSRRVGNQEKAHDDSPVAQNPELRYEEIIGVYVHRCDPLQPDRLLRSPLVKVYIVETASGEYLKKSDPRRSVAYFNESESVDFISPLMTQEYDFHARRSTTPSWEELIVFNEDISCILNPDRPVIVLLEILNSVSFSVASDQYKKLGADGGWHRVAWAFLKPVGGNGHLNIERECRLQLYRPAAVRRAGCDSCAAYSWWRDGGWRKYPGTLYVTVKAIRPPSNLAPVLRSRLAMQGENATATHKSPEGLTELAAADISAPSAPGVERVAWSRLPTQSCKVPNKRALALPTGARGCFVVRFSRAGLYLACATLAKQDYTVLVYTIPGGKEHVRLSGHQGLVYDLNWSADDTLLLSASADGTACVWTVAADKKSQLVQMLPHPGFVYAARFSPVNVATLVTACSDHVIRVWSQPKKTSLFELREELEEHGGYVTALCFDKDGTLVSGDSVGRILVWRSVRSKAISHRELRVRELQDVIINSLSLHPGGSRLLVHSRDSLLRMVDLTTASVIQWFHGGLNYRVQAYSTISPCGGLVLAATEDGTVCVWNSDTGEQTAVYSGLQFEGAASCVDYHPFEHMAAFCSATSHTGVVLAGFDKTSDGASVGLQMLTKVTEETKKEDLVADVSQGHGDSFTASKLVSSTPVKDGDTRMKLNEIIERMDKVLLATPAKSLAAATTPSKSPSTLKKTPSKSHAAAKTPSKSPATMTMTPSKSPSTLKKTPSESPPTATEIVTNGRTTAEGTARDRRRIKERA